MRPISLAGLGSGAVWQSDVVVIGSGVAGLSVALGATRGSVLLLTKTGLASGSTPLAQGGIAGAWDEGDSPALHAEDTCAVGGGLSDREGVELLCAGGPEAIARLLEWQMPFDSDGAGRPALGREAGHRRRRILHAGGDATGASLTATLLRRLRDSESVRIEERVVASDLLFAGQGEGEAAERVVGVLAWRGGRPIVALARRGVVLATGGLGQLFLRTTNPPEVTGDGLAMAARAGARLVDLEMVQFHPTALLAPGGDGGGREPMPLLTEALRGEGAELIDRSGRRFLFDSHADGELAPRDVVARAIWRQDREGGAFLDLRRLAGGPGAGKIGGQTAGETGGLAERFPTVARHLECAGIDPAREPVPVAPAAHYHMGGVLVDAWGRTSLPGLWACGEVASTGVHGANRLASNSLLEGLVFGARVASDLAGEGVAVARRSGFLSALRCPGGGAAACAMDESAAAGPADEALELRLRRLMWERVGLERDAAGLESALGEIAQLRRGSRGRAGSRSRPGRDRLLLAELLARAALARRESRGAHYRRDFPRRDPAWAHRLAVAVDRERGTVGRFEPLLVPGAERPVLEAAGA